MTFTIAPSTIKFYRHDDDGTWGEVAVVVWERKWNGKIRLAVQFVSRHCDMSELIKTMDVAIAAIKALSRTVG